MITTPMDVLHRFPIRKSKAQKQAFRDAVTAYAQSLGYTVRVEQEKGAAANVVIGDPAGAEYLVTAHYDTPASIGLPNVLTPCNPVAFIGYQIFLVAVFLVLAFGAAFLVSLVTESEALILLTWYVVYFGTLLLMMMGPANKSNANDNTSGVVTVLETLRTMPENQRHKAAFVLFDLEEMGLVGSKAYYKAHKAQCDRQVILNLDCVGDGNEIVFFPTKKLCKDQPKLRHLCKAVGRYGEKTIAVCHKGFRTYPSDQRNFPYGVGIAAFQRKKGIGLYCARIHTKKDTTLEETNVNILRAALTTLITND